MPRIYSGMRTYTSQERLALVEDIYNRSINHCMYCVCEIAWASSSYVFVSVRQFTVCLSEMTLLGSPRSEFQSQISSCFCLPWAKDCFCSPLYHVMQLYSLHFCSMKTRKQSLCHGLTSLTNLHDDTSFNSNFQTMYMTKLYANCNQSSVNCFMYNIPIHIVQMLRAILITPIKLKKTLSKAF